MSVSVDIDDYELPDNNERNRIVDNVNIEDNSRITFNYDGGRVSVYVDGVEIYRSVVHSHDVSIDLGNI